MMKTFKKISKRLFRFFKRKKNRVLIEESFTNNNLAIEIIDPSENEPIENNEIVLVSFVDTLDTRVPIEMNAISGGSASANASEMEGNQSTSFSRSSSVRSLNASEQDNSILVDKPLEESNLLQSANHDDLNCPICLELMENTYKTTCDHIFCSKCIIKMFKNKSNISCPMCRTTLQNDNITKIIKPIYDIPENPNFNFISNDHERNMLINAYNTLNRMKKWEFLKNYDTNAELGFMFDNNNEINNIKTQINIDNNDNHSGLSLAITMRHMNIIAKDGFSVYKESMGVYE